MPSFYFINYIAKTFIIANANWKSNVRLRALLISYMLNNCVTHFCVRLDFIGLDK